MSSRSFYVTAFRSVTVRVCGVLVVVTLERRSVSTDGDTWRAIVRDGCGAVASEAEHRDLETAVRLAVAPGSMALDALLDRIRRKTRFEGILTAAEHSAIAQQVADAERAQTFEEQLETDEFFNT